MRHDEPKSFDYVPLILMLVLQGVLIVASILYFVTLVKMCSFRPM
jgi:hypothetical protein